nr:FkbM family methyltransferase [uncultured Tolumonas sp.]
MNSKIMEVYSSMLKFSSLDDYPKECKIFIYANNVMAKNLLTIFTEQRPDIKILGFIDSFGKKSSEMIETISPDELNKKNYDYVVITLINYLDQLKDFISKIPPNKLILNLVANLAYHPPYLAHGFTPDKAKNTFIISKLHSSKDINLWNLLTTSMTDSSIKNLVEWFLSEGDSDLQYIEHYDLKHDDVVMELGVYDAKSSSVFAKKLDQTGRIIGFEPLGQEIYKKTLDNDLHLKEIMTIYPYAVSDKVGEISMHLNGSSTKIADDGTKIKCITIDAFVDENQISKLDLIKMDIEGAEPAALRGAKKTIKNLRPALAISIYHGLNQYIDIPFYLMNTLENYTFKLGCYSVFGLETVLYCIPNEKLK